MGQLVTKQPAAPSNNNKSNLKKPVKKIDRNLIGQPSNFQHTGHIGIGDTHKKDFDPEKIKNQMATIAASISLDDDEPKAAATPAPEAAAALPSPPPSTDAAGELPPPPPPPEEDEENHEAAAE